MNPLLNHTINELSKPNANTALVLADAFSDLLLQAKSNKRLNLCGGEYVDKNTAIPMQTKDVDCYHIDEQIGLNEFAKAINYALS